MNIKFNIAAIISYIKYGICKYPANLFLDKNSLIIIITNNINRRIQMNANVNNLNLKNINDHSKLTVNWLIYIFDIWFVSSYIKYDDIPINVYKIVHTSGNIQDGRILSMFEFKVVSNPTIVPSIKGIKIKIDSFL